MSHVRASRIRRLCITVAAIGLVLTAATVATANARKVTAGSIPIGFNGELTGNFATDGLAALEGVQVGVQAVNNAGGVMGRKLSVVTGDNRGDPVDAVPVSQQQVSVDHVVASVGPAGAFLVPCQRIYDQAGVPVFFWGGDPEWDHITDPLLWRTTPSDSELAIAMAVYARSKGYKRAAFVFESNAAEQGLKDDLLKVWKHMGRTAVVVKDLSPSQTSYRSEVQSVINAKPSVIFLATGITTGATLFANMRELNGLKIPIVADDKSHAADYIKAIGLSNAKRALVSLDAGLYNSGSTATFNSLYMKTMGHAPLGGSSYTYDAIIVMALAMEKAQSTNGKSLAAAIHLVEAPNGKKVYSFAQGVAALKAGAKTIKYVGISGPLDFNKYHNVFGPFAAYKATDTHGGVKRLVNLTAKQLAAAAK